MQKDKTKSRALKPTHTFTQITPLCEELLCKYVLVSMPDLISVSFIKLKRTGFNDFVKP